MRRKRLLWQLYPSYLLITVVSLVAVAWYALGELRQFYHDRTADDLLARARLVEDEFGRELAAGHWDEVDTLCKRLGDRTKTRITVILPEGENRPAGQVVGDSETSPLEMEHHSGRKREEIAAALAGETGCSVRPSPTLQQDMYMYVAIPLREGDRVIGVLRTSLPVTEIDQALRKIQWRIVAGGLVVALLVAAISLFISRRISRPLEQLKLGAERFAQGDLAHRLAPADSYEIGALAETMNQMASQLDDRIRTAVAERNEREAILSSMIEGVLAVDLHQRLISINQAGARLIGVDPKTALGRNLKEVTRSVELHELVAGVLSTQQPTEQEIVLYELEERFLQALGTVLRSATSEAIGVLVVLHDVTRIKRLEHVRRDFVANVSHELKTPITSIKGFVETLLEGALEQPDDARRFLQIISVQADRLGAIIEDLLELSRIERDAEKHEIALAEGPIAPVLAAAVEVCRIKAGEKDVRIEVACEDDLRAVVNPPLLEQAVVNLLDNAVKFSPAGQAVRVEATRTETGVVIRVRDRGCGISGEHLPRIFERFYRVDKARSRKLGGTGLGLAIVKHVAAAHGGRATVESAPGEGSTFSIHLPRVTSPKSSPRASTTV